VLPAEQVSPLMIAAIFTTVGVGPTVPVTTAVRTLFTPIELLSIAVFVILFTLFPYMTCTPPSIMPSAPFETVTSKFAPFIVALTICGFANRQLASSSLDWSVINFLTGLQTKVTPAITNRIIRTVATIADNPLLLYIVSSLI